jgi:hypothetical protein
MLTPERIKKTLVEGFVLLSLVVAMIRVVLVEAPDIVKLIWTH